MTQPCFHFPNRADLRGQSLRPQSCGPFERLSTDTGRSSLVLSSPKSSAFPVSGFIHSCESGRCGGLKSWARSSCPWMRSSSSCKSGPNVGLRISRRSGAPRSSVLTRSESQTIKKQK